MDFLQSLLESLLTWVGHHPYWAGTFVFLVSLAESLAVVGLLIPGTVVMFGVGALVAAGALELWPTLALAAAGAVVGDSMSYWLGYHYHDRLRQWWPFSRHPELLRRGEEFFHRHGGKSVLLGRFVGPVRPVIPVVAGMLNMPPRRFMVVNVLSALGWAPAYILPGVVFGASLGLASAVASRLAVIVVLLLLILWITVWGVLRIARLLQRHAEPMAARVLGWSRKHPMLGVITAVLVDPKQPELRGMAIWALLLLVLGLGLMGGLEALNTAPLARLDNAVFYILQGLRTPWADQFIVLLGQLGDAQVIVPLMLAVTLMLALSQHRHAAAHWLAALGFGLLLAGGMQIVLHLPRPLHMLPGQLQIFSHVAMSMLVYGFLAVLLARELPAPRRWLPYVGASLLIVGVAVARLYLGVHGLSEVLAGLLGGLLWAALLGVSYRRHLAPPVPLTALGATGALVLLLAGTLHISMHHARDVEQHAVRHSVRTVDAQAWWNGAWQDLPAYRKDLKGEPSQPLTLQWLGSIGELRRYLAARGWYDPVDLELKTLLVWLTPNPVLAELPVLPQVHDGRHESLLMVHGLPGQERQLVLRLWTADARAADGNTPLWVGNVTRHRVSKKIPLFTVARSEAVFSQPLAEFERALDGLAWKRVQRTGWREARYNNWNGEVILLRAAPGN
ncbi:MAG: VTT domain-containing protein [Gammaproteobacteria bacterium]|nr:VTT domain-containing protein [Gammaproteobacteria bacterium]